jgi:hypothetical protein
MSTLLFRSTAEKMETPLSKSAGTATKEPANEEDYFKLLRESKKFTSDEMKLLGAAKNNKFYLLDKYRRQARMADLVGRVVVFLALASVVGGILFVHFVNKKRKRWIVQIRINGDNPTDLYAAPYGSKWGHNYQEGVFMYNDISYTVKREVDSTDASMVGFTIFKTGDESSRPVSQIKTKVKNTTHSMLSTETTIRGVSEIKISRVKASKSQGEKETASLITNASPLLILGAVGVAIVLNLTGAAIVFAKRREYRTGYTQFEREEAELMLSHMKSAMDQRRQTRPQKG